MCIRDRHFRIYTSFTYAACNKLAILRTEIQNKDTIFSNLSIGCLLYTSDAADERSSVDLGGRRIIKKTTKKHTKKKTKTKYDIIATNAG